MAGLRIAVAAHMPGIFRHCSIYSFKDGWVIHVVPESVYTFEHIVSCQSTPPGTYFRTSVIREIALSWPNAALEIIATCVFHKIIGCFPLVIYEITVFNLNSRVNHVYTFHILGMCIVLQFLWVWKRLGIKCEYFELIHVVNVHPYSIAWEAFNTEAVNDFFYTGIWEITVTALLET